MDNELHDQLLAKVSDLRELLGKHNVIQVASALAVCLRKWINKEDDMERMHSPGKQCPYLIGLLLDTDAPENPETLSNDNTQAIIKLCNDVFNLYGRMYWPTENEEKLSDEWYRHREVAMPAFLHYYCNPVLASVEQIRDRIYEELDPFNEVIEAELNISVRNIVSNADEIARYQQEKLDRLADLHRELSEKHKEIVSRIPEEKFTRERVLEETQDCGFEETLEEYVETTDKLFCFDGSDISSSDGEVFLNTFSLERNGNVLHPSENKFTYITEMNPVEESPLIKTDGGVFLCYSTNALYIAILDKLTRIVMNSSRRESFLKKRDNLLESNAREILLKIIGSDATSESSLYESKDLHDEHDLIIIKDRNLYIVEAKASPPTEPFRDPEKAFIRIQRHFKSDRGIQKGFDQANGLKSRLLCEGKIDLYSDNQEIALTLDSEKYENIFCVVVTRDNFGPIASNLNLLLEKDDGESYPWVVDILELEVASNAFSHLGKSEEDLCGFLDRRINFHGKVFGTEELEFLGYFFRHGGFNQLISNSADLISLDSNYSDIFDEIYLAEVNSEKVVIKPKPAYMSDPISGRIITEDKAVKKKKEDKRKSKRKMQKASRKANRRKRKK